MLSFLFLFKHFNIHYCLKIGQLSLNHYLLAESTASLQNLLKWIYFARETKIHVFYFASHILSHRFLYARQILIRGKTPVFPAFPICLKR